MNVPRVAALVPLLLAGVARAADRPDARTVLAARDTVFARPEFALPSEGEPSVIEQFLRWFADLLLTFRDQYPTAFAIVAITLVLVLVVLIAHIVWSVAVARRARYEGPLATPALDLRLADPTTFRAAAVAAAARGDFESAVRELYTALLVALERRGDVSWARHKALLDYRLEARSPEARAALDLFAAGYHPTSFGRRPLPGDRFEALLARLDEVMA